MKHDNVFGNDFGKTYDTDAVELMMKAIIVLLNNMEDEDAHLNGDYTERDDYLAVWDAITVLWPHDGV